MKLSSAVLHERAPQVRYALKVLSDRKPHRRGELFPDLPTNIRWTAEILRYLITLGLVEEQGKHRWGKARTYRAAVTSEELDKVDPLLLFETNPNAERKFEVEESVPEFDTTSPDSQSPNSQPPTPDSPDVLSLLAQRLGDMTTALVTCNDRLAKLEAAVSKSAPTPDEAIPRLEKRLTELKQQADTREMLLTDSLRSRDEKLRVQAETREALLADTLRTRDEELAKEISEALMRFQTDLVKDLGKMNGSLEKATKRIADEFVSSNKKFLAVYDLEVKKDCDHLQELLTMLVSEERTAREFMKEMVQEWRKSGKATMPSVFAITQKNGGR